MNKLKCNYLGDLLQKSQDGDNVTYKLFLNEVSTELRPYVSKRVGSQENVEDILQEILISLHRARHTYLPDRPFSYWIYAIASNRIIDFYRKTNSLKIRKEKLLKIVLENKIVEDSDDDDAAESLNLALEKLPAKQRTIIKSLKLEELSIKEVASKMNMSEGAIKVSASRGYQALKKILGISKNENK